MPSPLVQLPTMLALRRDVEEDREREWVARARGGDEDAFRLLMDRHRGHAVAIALRITRSREDAEDVAQQAFVRAWSSLAQFRGDATFRTWLHRIVARRALDRAMQMKKQHDELDVDALPLLFTSEPARDVILIRRLEKLMQRLSAAQRAVVTLFYWEDTPIDDIATILGMPENTVKTHLSRARAALREAWLQSETPR